MSIAQLVTFMKEVDGLRFTGRWNGHFMFDRSNVAEHSFRVAWWASLITDTYTTTDRGDNTPLCTVNEHELYSCVQRTILSHDMAEKYTGDVRHDIKREYPTLKAVLDDVEEDLLNRVMPFRNKVTYSDEVRKITKAIYKGADILDFTLEALKEMKRGNEIVDFPVAVVRGLVHIQSLPVEDVSYICEAMFSYMLNSYGYEYNKLRDQYASQAQFHTDGVSA